MRFLRMSAIRASGMLMTLWLAGCAVQDMPAAVTAMASPASSTAATAVRQETKAQADLPLPATIALPAAATSTGASSAPSPTATDMVIPSSPTPHPMTPYTIRGMRQRTYPGGPIDVLALQEENESYRRYYIAYPSDGLVITGVMNIPRRQGPLPVLILLHGYFERDQYWSGADTWQLADFFARNGYLTIAPDYRSWGASDHGASFFHTGLVADTINLISSLPSLPQADTERVAMFGHSMGGGIATKVLLVDSRPAAAVLYSPNSADDVDLIARWGPGCLPGQSQAEGDHCNPGEVIPSELPPEMVEAYLAAASDPEMLRRIAPIYHLEALSVPVQIHSGEADGELLVHTPPQWAHKLAGALQASGKEVEFYSYAGQGHYFQSPAWDQMSGRALDFLDRHLKP